MAAPNHMICRLGYHVCLQDAPCDPVSLSRAASQASEPASIRPRHKERAPTSGAECRKGSESRCIHAQGLVKGLARVRAWHGYGRQHMTQLVKGPLTVELLDIPPGSVSFNEP